MAEGQGQGRKEAPKPDHYHVWAITPETRTAAFLSRPFNTREAANKWARRWVGESNLRIVWACKFGDQCPRKPKPNIGRC